MLWYGAQSTAAPAEGGDPGGGISFYAADNANLSYTDCVAPTFVNGFARFRRPLVDTGSDFQYCMPGGRLRFRTNATSIAISLRYNGLVTRADARNFIGHVYIDGVYNNDFQTPYAVNVVNTQIMTLSNPSGAYKLVEVILPYADGVEFGGVTIDPAYVITPAAPRTGRLMVCLGDSITQGFFATDVRRSWPFLLAEAKGFRCINLGYGGRTTIPADGTAAANLNPDLITVLLGMNDYFGQTPVAAYKANLKQLLVNIHAVNPTVPVYISAITLTTQSLSIPLSSYRPAAGECIDELGYSQLVGVDTGTLIANSTQLTPDGVHPNNDGTANMASGWGAVIT